MSAPETPTAAYEAFRARKTFANLDGLRALSILVVVWHHTFNRLEPFPGAGRGFLGVDMFFALSGFLIVSLVLRERDRNGQISLKRFYMRRTLRIFPLYYLVVGIVAALCVVRGGNVFNYALFSEGLPYYLTYTSNWHAGGEALPLAVAWSLAAEEQFYILWPPIERFLKKAALPILGLALLYNQAINFELVPMPFGTERAEHEILQSTFTPILLGVGLAHALHRRGGFEFVYRAIGRRAAPLVILAALVAVANIPNEDIGGLHRLSIQVLMTTLLASVVVREDGIGTPLFRLKPVLRCGQISYGLYLWHMLARALAFRVLARLGFDDPDAVSTRGALFVTVLVGAWILSELSFRFFEMPFLKLKKRFTV